MSKKRTAKQIVADIKAAWDIKVAKSGQPPLETFERFFERASNLAAAQDIGIKLAAKKYLSGLQYTSYEQRVHKNVVDILREEGMYSRLYRMGGRTAFDASTYDGTKREKVIEIEIETKKFYIPVHSSGTYNMGGVEVTIWTADEGSQTQYIEFYNPETGAQQIQARKGQAI